MRRGRKKDEKKDGKRSKEEGTGRRRRKVDGEGRKGRKGTRRKKPRDEKGEKRR